MKSVVRPSLEEWKIDYIVDHFNETTIQITSHPFDWISPSFGESFTLVHLVATVSVNRVTTVQNATLPFTDEGGEKK